MIKKLLMALLVALPFSSMAQKFGVVDLESIFTSMPESAAMQTQLQETTTKYEEEFGKLQEEVNKLYTEYQTIANDANTPESIKERRVQEIQERAAKVDQFRNTAQQDIQRCLLYTSSMWLWISVAVLRLSAGILPWSSRPKMAVSCLCLVVSPMALQWFLPRLNFFIRSTTTIVRNRNGQ